MYGAGRVKNINPYQVRFTPTLYQFYTRFYMRVKTPEQRH